jgi:hypothetical protein
VPLLLIFAVLSFPTTKPMPLILTTKMTQLYLVLPALRETTRTVSMLPALQVLRTLHAQTIKLLQTLHAQTIKLLKIDPTLFHLI